MESLGPAAPAKKHAHLALDDIRESIEELRFYRDNYFGLHSVEAEHLAGEK